ncbi:MAG: tetratricopeptide repeat protein [Candidatus Binatia bacterium]
MSVRFAVLPLALLLAGAGAADAKLSKGDPAPPFELANVSGGRVSSAGLGDGGLTILTFVALDSKPSRELALALEGMRKAHEKSGLTVIAVAGDPADKLKEFVGQHSIGYAVCADAAKEAVRRYGAEQIVPMSYIIGPGGTIAEIIPGGGAGVQQVLLAVAEKEIARGNAETATALYEDVAEKDPKNAEARAGQAFALLKEGKLERAEEAFEAVSGLGGSASGLAAEGIAEVRLRQGDLDGATNALAKASADSGYADVIRGEIAVRRGKLDEAQKNLQSASQKQFAFDWQKGVTFNNMARISREAGDTDRALGNYDKAIAAEPFLVEARSNKGVALEKAGRVDEAKKTLASAKAIAPSDQVVATLLRRMEEREKEKLDLERQKFTNQLVNELADAFRSGKLPKAPADDWAPRALVVSFLDLKDQLGPLSRDGLPEVFLVNLTSALQETGRVKVVEREIIDKLLAELKLGSSELADPATRLKLGRVLAASVIGTGGWYPRQGGSELQLRLVDTETTDIRKTLSEPLANPGEIGTFAEKIAGKISATLQSEYPLRGKIASVESDEIIVGVGKKHGAQTGLQFKVVEDGDPIQVDGEVIGHKQRTVGTLELTKVEDGFAYAKSVSGAKFAKGQHVVEAAP